MIFMTTQLCCMLSWSPKYWLPVKFWSFLHLFLLSSAAGTTVPLVSARRASRLRVWATLRMLQSTSTWKQCWEPPSAALIRKSVQCPAYEHGPDHGLGEEVGRMEVAWQEPVDSKRVSHNHLSAGHAGRTMQAWTPPAVEDTQNCGDDAADEIMERIVRSATQGPGTRTQPRERRRSRANRKSCTAQRRTSKSILLHVLNFTFFFFVV